MWQKPGNKEKVVTESRPPFTVRSISINGVEIPVTEQQAEEISKRTLGKFNLGDPVGDAADRLFYRASPQGPCDGQLTIDLLCRMRHEMHVKHPAGVQLYRTSVYVPEMLRSLVQGLTGVISTRGMLDNEIGHVSGFHFFTSPVLPSMDFGGRAFFPVVMVSSDGEHFEVRGVMLHKWWKGIRTNI